MALLFVAAFRDGPSAAYVQVEVGNPAQREIQVPSLGTNIRSLTTLATVLYDAGLFRALYLDGVFALSGIRPRGKRVMVAMIECKSGKVHFVGLNRVEELSHPRSLLKCDRYRFATPHDVETPNGDDGPFNITHHLPSDLEAGHARELLRASSQGRVRSRPMVMDIANKRAASVLKRSAVRVGISMEEAVTIQPSFRRYFAGFFSCPEIAPTKESTERVLELAGLSQHDVQALLDKHLPYDVQNTQSAQGRRRQRQQVYGPEGDGNQHKPGMEQPRGRKRLRRLMNRNVIEDEHDESDEEGFDQWSAASSSGAETTSDSDLDSGLDSDTDSDLDSDTDSEVDDHAPRSAYSRVLPTK